MIELLDDVPVYDKLWKTYWKGMPEFEQNKINFYKTLDVFFPEEKDWKDFQKKVNQEALTDKAKFCYFPEKKRQKFIHKRWIGEPRVNPRYPIYIVSKGRADTRYTSKALEEMQVPYYIAIEPQDYESYSAVIDPSKILVLPFSNHGQGPGRARNWCWDHSISIGAEKHWVLDDNIRDFLRLHKNERIRVSTGAVFAAAEDFIDRFENVPVSGFQYKSFLADIMEYGAFSFNCRIYSCLLIDNKCRHRWRGKYNEDTDLSLNVLKDGDCTIQFNIFLQDKMATQVLKGGNTAEFYHAEGTQDKSKWRGGQLNPEGTINKSEMLVNMHPDVARIEFKYGRVHHFVDYSPFKKNKLRYKPGIIVPEGINEYGMKYIEDYEYERK